jgi:hypothetical protein
MVSFSLCVCASLCARLSVSLCLEKFGKSAWSMLILKKNPWSKIDLNVTAYFDEFFESLDVLGTSVLL